MYTNIILLEKQYSSLLSEVGINFFNFKSLFKAQQNYTMSIFYIHINFLLNNTLVQKIYKHF